MIINLARIGRWIAIKRRRTRLKNHDFSIISNTCVGGVMTHNVGEQFRSPTVNLVIFSEDYITFCKNLKEYVCLPVEEPSLAEKEIFNSIDHPLGIIRGSSCSLQDIPIVFTHYKSFEEGRKKWEQRCKRINYDNLFIVLDCGTYATEALLDEFHALPYKNKVIFSQFNDPQRWPYNFHFSYYTKETFESGMAYRNIQKGLFRYQWMDEFDYVKWLNEGTISAGSIRIMQ